MRGLGRTTRLMLIVAAALAVTAAPVLAANNVRGSLSGFEDALPASTCTTNTAGTPCQTAYFAGYFSAKDSSDSGFWSATVEHEGLPTQTSGSTDIVGGSFALYMVSGTVVSGSGMTGSISYDGKPTMSLFGCTQTYKVDASLTLSNKVLGLASGTADAYLTHYGTGESGGSCTGVYFATISGFLTLTNE